MNITKQNNSDMLDNGWWDILPKHYIKWIRLGRFDRPVGFWLLLLPGWWVLPLTNLDLINCIKLMFIFLIGSIVMRAAGCTINDMWDKDIDKKISRTKRPVMMSTGMSTMNEIQTAIEILDCDNFLLAHATSSYPASYDELNLNMIKTLDKIYDCPIGYSGHEVGLSTTISTIALGATFIERHITLSRAMWGTDHSASVEPQGMIKLARDIRLVESAMGDGVKKVYDSEKPIIAKLRGNS